MVIIIIIALLHITILLSYVSSYKYLVKYTEVFWKKTSVKIKKIKKCDLIVQN